jgi:hypothetical protein
MTLIELFAWLVEGMQYRLNKAPVRTYAAMLNLVGITRDPARPSVTMLTFTPQVPPPTGAAAPIVTAGTAVSTVGTETQAPITFQTDIDATVLPANLLWAYVPVQNQSSTTYRTQDISGNLIESPLSGWSFPLQSNAPGQSPNTAQLFFGFDTAIAPTFSLNIRIAIQPLQPSAIANWVTTAWAYTVTTQTSPGAQPNTNVIPTGPNGLVDNTNNLLQSGTVNFPVLTGWAQRPLSDVMPAGTFDATDPNWKQKAFWLCLTVTAPPTPVPPPTSPPTPPPPPLNYTVNVAHLLFNSVSATRLITQTNEQLSPPSTGLPWQQYQFQYSPHYQMPGVSDPYGHVIVTVDGAQVYAIVDDFPRAPDQTRCCRLDPVTATIMFGSNDGTPQSSGTGLIPPSGSTIAASYKAVGGGADGNVAPGVLLSWTAPTGVQSVTNPGPGRGGADQESVDDAMLRAPDLLRIRNRAVTAEDYQALAIEANTLVKKTAALGASVQLDGYGGFSRAAGSVTVLVVPDSPPDNPQPKADAELISDVLSYLDARRVVSTALTVSSPRYAPMNVTAIISLFPSANIDPTIKSTLQVSLTQAASLYLHPLFGGSDGTGWNIGDNLFVSGLFVPLQAIIGTSGYISQLSVDVEPGTRPEGNPPNDMDNTVGKLLYDFELLCSGIHHNIQVNILS